VEGGDIPMAKLSPRVIRKRKREEAQSEKDKIYKDILSSLKDRAGTQWFLIDAAERDEFTQADVIDWLEKYEKTIARFKVRLIELL